MLSAEVRIISEKSEIIIASLRPEAVRELPRTHVTVRMDGSDGVLSIKADDTTAMRAALNSYLGCIRIAENIDRITKVNE